MTGRSNKFPYLPDVRFDINHISLQLVLKFLLSLPRSCAPSFQPQATLSYVNGTPNLEGTTDEVDLSDLLSIGQQLHLGETGSTCPLFV